MSDKKSGRKRLEIVRQETDRSTVVNSVRSEKRRKKRIYIYIYINQY